MNFHYLEFEVELMDVPHRPWRRFELRHTFSFEELHGAIQMAGGWQCCHLYEFHDGEGRSIASVAWIEDLAAEKSAPPADDVPLRGYFKQPGQEVYYIYDFGDHWRHRVRFVGETTNPRRWVQRLTGGEGVFPPEDCGGPPGFEQCVRACMLTEAEEERLDPIEREEMISIREWLGDWRPEGFDLAAAKRAFLR